MAMTDETKRMQQRYINNLDNPNWTEDDLRILNSAICDRLQLELPGNQVPFYPPAVLLQEDGQSDG